MLKHRGIDGCRCLQGLLQGLPASHPAVIWTTGSVRTTHTSTTRQCNMVAVSKFHHRSIHNIQHTLPSFRRPTGISLYQYVSLRDLLQKSGTKESLVGDVSKDSAKALTLAPLRLIHSEKQQSKQRPFVLSPQGIVAASPTVVQPYLRLVRLDRPIGKDNQSQSIDTVQVFCRMRSYTFRSSDHFSSLEWLAPFIWCHHHWHRIVFMSPQ